MNADETDLEIYRENITETRSNVVEMHNEVTDLREVADDVINALETPEKIERELESLGTQIDTILKVLTITSKIGPLSGPSKVLSKTLKDAKKIISDLEQKAENARMKVDASPVKINMELARDKLISTELSFMAMEDQIDGQIKAIDGFLCTIDILAPRTDAWEALVNSVAGEVNGSVEAVNEIYDDVKAEILEAKDIIDVSVVNPVLSAAYDVQRLLSKIDFLDGPLSIARTLIEPIEPILTAVDAISKAIIDPVIDKLIDELGLDTLFDKIEKEIRGLLPDLDIFDGLLDGVDPFNAEALEIFNFGFDADTWLTRIEDDLLQDFIDPSTGPTGIGTDDDDTLTGGGNQEGINGGNGDDEVFGGDGADFLQASAGDDTINGGDGEDFLFFKANFSEFMYGYEVVNGPFSFRHVDPRRSSADLGREVLEDVEWVAFLDGAIYSVQDLIENTKFATPGNPLNGTIKDDFLFAQSASAAVIYGWAGNDRIVGSSQTDSLSGGAGDDIIDSRGNGFDNNVNDTVNGGDGNDTWLATTGSIVQANLIEGTAFAGGRVDLISIENLTMQADSDAHFIGNWQANRLVGGEGEDTLKGNNGNDTLVGGNDHDWLFGGRGTDILIGGAGNDTLVGGWDHVGGEVFDGGDNGSGSGDWLTYSSAIVKEQSGGGPIPFELQESNFGASGSIRVYAKWGQIERLAADGQTVLGNDTAEGIERFYGSDFNDTMVGGYFGDELHEINGAGGDDTLFTRSIRLTKGGSGDDTINVTLDPDFFVDLGSTNDFMVFDGGQGSNDILNLNLVDNTRSVISYGIGNSGKVDVFRGDEIDAISSTSGGGGGSVSRLFGGSLIGIEIIQLGDLNDSVVTQDGAITVFGGGGDDEMRNIQGQANYVFFYGEDGDDDLQINFVDGGLSGGNGNDLMRVANSASSDVWGGNGDDTVIVSREGGGSLWGGAGFDRLVVNWTQGGVPVTINLDTRVLEVIQTNTSIEATIGGFEEVIGSQISDIITGRDFEADRIIGRANNDTIDASGGDDVVFGNLGTDNIQGGWGDDTINGGLNGDFLDGGFGTDTLDFSNASASGDNGAMVAEHFFAAIADLSTSYSALVDNTTRSVNSTDQIFSFENLSGTSFDDSLTGDDDVNVISGGRGSDTMNGLGGDDVIIMGGTFDTVHAGWGADRIVIGSGGGTVEGGFGNDRLALGNEARRAIIDFDAETIELVQTTIRVVWLDTGTTEARTYKLQDLTPQDVLEADPFWSNDISDTSRELPNAQSSQAEDFLIEILDDPYSTTVTYSNIASLEGGTMETVLRPGAEMDVFFGGIGSRDILDLTGLNALTFNLQTRVSSDARLNGDQIFGIDEVWGTFEDDVFTGTNGANLIRSRAGADYVDGLDGDDALYGDWGNDTILGGDGDDYLNGGQGDDVIRGQDDNDWLVGAEGNDELYGGAGNDGLRGKAGNDTIRGGLGDDNIKGEWGDDLLTGGLGADKFTYLDWFDIDIITDFSAADDTLLVGRELMNGVPGDIGDLVDTFGVEIGNDVVFNFGNGDILTVQDITLAALETAMDFA